MITKIGITAGHIWHYLDQNKKSDLTKIAKGTDQPRDMVLMSVGWLAREGHVVVEKEGKGYQVWLRQE